MSARNGMDSSDREEPDGGDAFRGGPGAPVPFGSRDPSARYGSRVVVGNDPPMGPTSAGPPRRNMSSAPNPSALPPRRIISTVPGPFGPPSTTTATTATTHAHVVRKHSGYTPPLVPTSRKSSFVPPQQQLASGEPAAGDSAAPADSFRGTLKLPTRSTRAFASRIRTSLISIPEGAAAANRPAPRGVGRRNPNQRRPAPPVGGASTITGLGKTVRLSVVPAGLQRNQQQQQQAPGRILSFQPKNLIDIETGKSIVITAEAFLDESRYQELDESGVVTARGTVPIAKEDALFFQEHSSSLTDRMANGTVRDFEANNEVGALGGFWRGILKRLMLLSYDEINGLRLTRQAQTFIPFQTGYEAYILGQLVEAMDSNRMSDIKYVLNIAFKNRNVSRILVQLSGPRYDFFWHWAFVIRWNRSFDLMGQLPIIGVSNFPATENFPSTRNHALASIFRVLLGQGNWITRVITRNRQGLVTDNPNNVAQNLAAENNGFELANRNQHGTYIGRRLTNQFRWSHRLPTDESLVRTFLVNPGPTMLNNGVVHVLRQLANHWNNMLYQFSGNFAHQRQEQLNPFETLRFHMPVVLLTLSSFRGRNKWDSKVMAPFIRQLQELNCSWSGEAAKYLLSELKDKIIVPASGGIAAIVDPFMSWVNAIREAVTLIEEEAKKVYEIVTSVEVGIRLGHDLITKVSWKLPSDRVIKKAILAHIKTLPVVGVNERRIRTALTLVTPRDKRTLIELVNNGLGNKKPAQLLLGRAKTLTQRELRRENLNEAIRELSKGKEVTDPNTFEHDNWYWIEGGARAAVFIYDARETGQDRHRFIHVDTKYEKFVNMTDGSKKFYEYIPVAEAISRAQRAYMNIELDHGKKFIYNAFMEFSYLRVALRNLSVISQIFCEELDNARLNVLAEIQRSNQAQISLGDCEVGETYYTYNNLSKSYEPFVWQGTDAEWDRLGRVRVVKYPPQSLIVVGGGPTGLTTVLHCTENVLISGGVMKLYEARDAFAKGGATFERAQIVRLDARWIAMLRYHLGTGFEDVYLPASGETDSQLGNTLPGQGFVEITIKDLENMLHVEISKMWAKGLIQVYTDAKSTYDVPSNSLTKLGKNLSIDDAILRKFDEEGNPSSSYHSWKVVDHKYIEPVSLKDLVVGKEYGVFIRKENTLLPYMLTTVDLSNDVYTFTPIKEGQILKATASSLPTIYEKGTVRHAEAQKVIIESVKRSSRGGYVRVELPMPVIREQKFTLDVGHTHVVEATGKAHNSKVHFSVTTYEPYGVCCLQGLKVSMGMHNFGEKRWGSGIIDDIRSHTDQNTRIIGDFTKMVRSAPIAEFMRDAMTSNKDKNWQLHFKKVVADSKFPDLDNFHNSVDMIRAACVDLAQRAPSFRRQTLQTRFFETGDNYYIGMEFTREYDKWKNALGSALVAPLFIKAKDDAKMIDDIEKFKNALMHNVDRLWYDGALEVIRKGDVYNPGARRRVPRLYVINSYEDMKLGSLPVGESFRLSDKPEEKYEVVIRTSSSIVVRNVEGYISKMKKSVKVRREGNLTRGPDGNKESAVCLATFPVGHYVNFRTFRLNDIEKGYVFAFIGDEQSTPHFMRYSGLTGACINAMLFNNFIKQAVNGDSFIDRIRLYSVETNWCNGEVVQRGTTANYGDGFLRPGFPVDHGIDYLHSKVIEFRESDQNLDEVVSRDWLIKLAASMVPRGLEMNENFISALNQQVQKAVFDKFLREIKADNKMQVDGLEEILRRRYDSMIEVRESGDYNFFWNDYMDGLEIDDETKMRLADPHVFIARRLDQICIQVIDFAKQAYLYNARISSELFNQPKSADSIIDDFAVEAQNFANGLAQSAAFSSGALAFSLLGSTSGFVLATLLSIWNIFVAFGTMTESARYKIRNEEARVIFKDEKLTAVMKGAFSVMDPQTRGQYPIEQNPFVEHLEEQVNIFYNNVKYYDYDEPTEFTKAFDELKGNINDPAAIREFQRLLTKKFIADTYHVNSYVQESLVNVFKTCEDMHYLLTQDVARRGNDHDAKKLFDRLVRFRPRLEKSLQRGPTRWGFIKQRPLIQWDCLVVFKYFYGLLCFSTRSGTLPCATIDAETKSLVKQTRFVSSNYGGVVLRREIRDLEALYYASGESNIGSLIFTTGFLVFLAAILFTVARIVDAGVDNAGSQSLVDAAFWAAVPSTFGAILATFHFVRKFFILIRLWCTLAWKTRTAAGSDARDRIRQVRRVTRTQIFLVVMRIVGALGASVALPWSIAENGFGDQISLNDRLPFWIALGSVGMWVVSTIYFFFVEFAVRYNLDPKLGEYVCESFRDEIEDMYKVLENPPNSIDTKQVQERETWEYVAREFLHKYRFDTVFAGDRFGSILQYIQAGMEPRM